MCIPTLHQFSSLLTDHEVSPGGGLSELLLDVLGLEGEEADDGVEPQYPGAEQQEVGRSPKQLLQGLEQPCKTRNPFKSTNFIQEDPHV